ncbi:MAG: hypothetical protein HQL57_03330 [Magnetococcales bacterium]|nr:hypothetical protein [Magnetococcales bacterium]MBF0156202.1 hypothetical protein [Magnetococcales bacterium]
MKETLRQVKGIVLLVLFMPQDIFLRMRHQDLFPLAFLLQAIRWEGTALTTMMSIYRYAPPMLLPVPFGLEQSSYRMAEVIAYGPYGFVIISAMAYVLWRWGRSHARGGEMSFRRCWALVGLTFFTPWIPSLLIDSYLVRAGLGGPMVIIPWHVTIVVVECVLTAKGLILVFDLPVATARRLAGAVGLTFLFAAGLLIR